MENYINNITFQIKLQIKLQSKEIILLACHKFTNVWKFTPIIVSKLSTIISVILHKIFLQFEQKVSDWQNISKIKHLKKCFEKNVLCKSYRILSNALNSIPI